MIKLQKVELSLVLTSLFSIYSIFYTILYFLQGTQENGDNKQQVEPSGELFNLQNKPRNTLLIRIS